jgi:hypothetical protein
MKFKIVQLSQFNGNKAGIYSIYVFEEQKTLFECFLRENMVTFKSEIININKTIVAINKKTGARETFFKLNEGNPGDGVCALYDNPDSNLRLYCIRYGSSLIILGGGGFKPKNIRKLQDDEKLLKENYLLRNISALITERIKTEEIQFSDDENQLYGNLEFED